MKRSSLAPWTKIYFSPAPGISLTGIVLDRVLFGLMVRVFVKEFGETWRVYTVWPSKLYPRENYEIKGRRAID